MSAPSGSREPAPGPAADERRRPPATPGVSLGSATIRLVSIRGIGYLLALVNSVIILRSLTVQELGAYTYAMGLAALFGLLPNMGIGTVITREVARDRATRSFVRTGIVAQLGLAVAVTVVVPAFAALLPAQPVPVGYVALAAAQLGMGALSWPYLAVISGRVRYDKIALADLISAVAGTLALVAAALARPGVPAFLLAHLAASAVAVATARFLAAPFFPTARGPRVRIHELIRTSLPFGVAAFLQSLYTRIDIVFLGQISTARALGLYGAAYKPTNFAVAVGGTVSGTLFPVMARPPLDAVPRTYRRASRGLAVLAPAMALTLTGLASPVLALLGGQRYVPAATLLAVLAWAAAANWLYGPLGTTLQARGAERLWLLCLAGGLALNVAGNLWAIPRYGALGAAGTTLATEAILVLLALAAVVRRTPVRPSGARALGIVAGAALGLVALRLTAPAGPWLSTVAALLVYGSVAFLTGAVRRTDLGKLSGWLREALPGMPGRQ